MSRLKVMSNHADKNYWNQSSNYIEFTENEGNCKLYTLNPWEVETETRDISKCAFIIEPYSLCPTEIDYVYNNWNKFNFIFTHDDRLLTLPNAKLYYWAQMWGSDITVPKTKNLSMISSNKRMCQLHHDRIDLAFYIKDNHLGDTFGTFDNGSIIDTVTAHSSYKFAIAVENYIEDWWFTEKINNCFANKTVPIYIGAKKIKELFDVNGIIQVNNTQEIKELLKNFDFDKEYEKRKEVIEYNYQESFKYVNIWDNLYKKFEKELAGIIK